MARSDLVPFYIFGGLAVAYLLTRGPSKDFTWEELTTTGTGLPNNPGPADRARLALLAREVLQPIRDRFGPLVITSAYRSAEVNQAVGGASASHHLKGNAADLYATSGATNEEIAAWVYRAGLPIRESIVERHTGHYHLARDVEGIPSKAKYLQTSDGRNYTAWTPGGRANV
jgi:hypothetical protein